MSLEKAPDAIEDLPPSAKLVWEILDEEGELTISELTHHARLSDPTVRYALNRLEDADLIDEETSMTDRRKNVYSTAN